MMLETPSGYVTVAGPILPRRREDRLSEAPALDSERTGQVSPRQVRGKR
jgi:hypothetical protein